VIVIACLCILSWFVVAQYDMQRALQWWHSRQATQLYQEAESIRNGLLQESFTMRRSLELTLAQPIDRSTAEQDCLRAIEQLHGALKDLSDRLSPPYVDDSLPLAIQAVVTRWKVQRPLVCLQWKLPANWQPEPYDRSRLILAALDELLRLQLSETVERLVVQLQQGGGWSELRLEFTPIAPSGCQELRYLRRAFRFLSFGACFCQRTDQATAWYFRWRSSANLS
jgi:hypothetical protein